MKIQGPGGPGKPPGIEPGEAAAEKPRVGPAFADKLAEARPPEAASAAQAAAAADPVASVAADLKAGRLTPKQAVERLLDLVSSRGPAAGLPDKVRARLRAELEDLLRTDPGLAAKARRLGVRDDEEG